MDTSLPKLVQVEKRISQLEDELEEASEINDRARMHWEKKKYELDEAFKAYDRARMHWEKQKEEIMRAAQAYNEAYYERERVRLTLIEWDKIYNKYYDAWSDDKYKAYYNDVTHESDY